MSSKKKDQETISDEEESENEEQQDDAVDEEDAGPDDGSELGEDLDFTVDEQVDEPLDHETLEHLELDETIDQESHIVSQSATIRTTEYITKYEKTRVLGWRAQQICSGAAPMLRADEKDSDGNFIFKDGKYPREPYEIALRELEHGRCPVIIGRRIPNGEKILIRVSNLKLIV